MVAIRCLEASKLLLYLRMVFGDGRRNVFDVHFQTAKGDSDLQTTVTLPETNIAPENGWLEY